MAWGSGWGNERRWIGLGDLVGKKGTALGRFNVERLEELCWIVQEVEMVWVG